MSPSGRVEDGRDRKTGVARPAITRAGNRPHKLLAVFLEYLIQYHGKRIVSINIQLRGRRTNENMSKQYIYQMAGLTKKYGQREILKDVWLAFYPGAKIGVLGRNGSGKSTLLRIMAGADRDFDGESRLTDGFTVGYVPQEPMLDPSTDVRGNIELAVSGTRQLLQKFEAINARFAEPLDDAGMEKLLAEQRAYRTRLTR